MKNIKIGVAYHKESIVISNETYFPIQVGKELHPELDLGIQPDNTGDNISGKNDYYCELTALYWIWKNVTADYKGLCHYRRFFSSKSNMHYVLYKLLKPIQSLRSHLFFDYPVVNCDCSEFLENAGITLRTIDRLLDKYDIICPKRVALNRSSYWHFVVYGLEIMDIVRSLIKEKYPTYYKYIENRECPSSFYFGNMSIMRNEIFNEYCAFLFGVLGETEDILIKKGWYKDLHCERSFSRKLGYFGEYLTDLFIRKKISEGIKVKELYISALK